MTSACAMNEINKPYAILISGPTASGKSAMALELAERFSGTVINADSMQVYRDLKVLTARPDAADEARAPHALYGFVDAADAYSAGRFAVDAAGAIAIARQQGRVPVVVGGTGLYFKALLEGLSPIPPIPVAIRARWRGESERVDAADLHDVLAARDPVMAARLSPTDPQRIVRALEVLEATGRSLAEWQAVPGEPILRESQTERLVVLPDRDELYRRCDARFERMLDEGALEEVRALAARKLDSNLPAMRALGVRPLMQLIAGKIDRATAIAVGQAETRQYAKRQITWLKRNMSAWKMVSAQ